MRDIRVQAGLSLGQFAKLMGVAAATAAAWERGLYSMQDDEIVSASQFLCCTPDELRASLPSAEDAKAEETRFAQLMGMMVAAKRDSKRHGFGVGSPGGSSFPCPKCETGTLRYHVASNGHMRGQCSTEGCAAWME